MSAPNNEWMVALLTLEALPYLPTLPHDLTDDECDTALGLAFQRLQSQLPFDEACDLYCDLDMRFPEYIDALRDRFAAREVSA